MLVKNCKIALSDNREVLRDILIEDGMIVKIEAQIPLTESGKAEVVDAGGKLVLPGVVDPHTHMRDPGLTHKEDFTTGSMAAAKGGVTTFLDMPNTLPPVITLDLLLDKKKKAVGRAWVDYGFYFGGAKSDNSAEIPKTRGLVAATKVFLNVSTGDMLVEDLDILERIFRNSELVAVHAEGEMVDRAIGLCEKTGVPLYLCHLSLASEVKSLEAAKAKGLPVYGEATPHHLFLTREDMEENEHTRQFLRMKPELKEKSDVEYLWRAVRSGVIDTIGTDHAPHTIEEKTSKLTSGVPGVEHSLELLLTAVGEGKITLPRLMQLLSEKPAEIFGLGGKGGLKEGKHGDLVIVDQTDRGPVEEDKIISKSGWTPYGKLKRGGRVLTTILRGRVVYDRGKFYGPYGVEIACGK
ncbi:MAG: dihydroorotase family protein [Fusobacteriaceae bacterium]|jgi:dihydroorotase|nr:dihydroorotase family protein [Fusobacteriaceae bacterium]